MTEPCSCQGPGYCPRHAVPKGPTWFKLYRTRPNYRPLWDGGRGLGQLRVGGIGPSPDSGPRQGPLPARRGPGTSLKPLLRTFGIAQSGGYGCRNHARVMEQDRRERCGERPDNTVGSLDDKARRRALPFTGLIGELRVMRAIVSGCKDLGMKAVGLTGDREPATKTFRGRATSCANRLSTTSRSRTGRDSTGRDGWDSGSSGVRTGRLSASGRHRSDAHHQDHECDHHLKS